MVSDNHEPEQVTTLKDLYRRTSLPEIDKLEVEIEQEETEEELKEATVTSVLMALLIGTTGSLIASVIWKMAIAGG